MIFSKGEFTQDCSTTDPSVAGRQYELSRTWQMASKLNFPYLNLAAVNISAEEQNENTQ